MPDTLIEEPIRPTVIDDPALAPAAGDPAAASPGPPGRDPAGAPRRPGSPASVPRGACLAVALALVAALAALALGLYFFFWRYAQTARDHIPGDANIVVRLEAAQLALFGPVRQHFFPLLDEARAGSPRKARIEAATGLDPLTDVREIVIASTDAASWVVLAGGRIPRGRFVAGMEKVARDEGWSGWRRDGELLVGPSAAIGQADDGTLVLGTDVEIVKAALPASDEWRRLDLPEQGPVTFALTRAALSGAAGEFSNALPRAGTALPRAGALLRRVDRASGVLTLGAEPALVARLAPVSGEAAPALAADAQAALGSVKPALAMLPDVWGARAALDGAEAQAQGELVEIRARWPYEGLDRACAELAQRARAAGGADAAVP
ncbi:hypothetical protein SOCE26_081660 [Sorangium cellulosum]|uniref:Uncharacterized protein n=1 Tax=Sorangium cellulosum TaxID=56 RepID=A0A2L0F5E5_SORCE|nr:hypothetical protein [Sorangium cellulosum]AUX46659.1 hypothetical protein SOCE26_081660 [Sorangium cellulosum]